MIYDHFILGVGVGIILTHVMYLLYFHFCLLNRIDTVIYETRKMIDDAVQKSKGTTEGMLSFLFPIFQPRNM